jgi:PhnB protein
MGRVSTYLNFMGNTEEAFNFYRSVFGTNFVFPINRFGDVPADENLPALSEAEKKLVMHVELPILGGHVLMATDMIESMGHELRVGNNVTINLEPDTRAETSGMQDMIWGSYWGSCLDRFGVRWMFSCAEVSR